MDNFLGEIRLAGFGFAPRNWALCNGALLPINQNQALFSLLGTTYGGNGTTTFALPDLRGRVPVGYGNNNPLGSKAGTEGVALTVNNIPAHNHAAITGTINTAGEALSTDPTGAFPAPATNNQYAPAPATGALAKNALAVKVQNSGNSQPHENRQPFQVMNYIIALQGIFPSRS